MALDADVLEQFIDQVKRLVTEKLVPNEERLVEDDDIPDEIVDDLKDLGFFGLSIPEEYGGLGLCLTDEAKIMMEFCQSSVAYRSRIGTNNGIDVCFAKLLRLPTDAEFKTIGEFLNGN